MGFVFFFDFFQYISDTQIFTMYKNILLLISCFFYLSCIGTDVTDDYVDPTLRIISPQIISIKVNQKFQFTAKYFDTNGSLVNNPNLIWTVSPPDALTINDTGLATATSDGIATIRVSVVTALGTTISAETSFTIQKAVTVIPETETMSANTGTTTSVADTSTTTIDNDLVETVPQHYQGTIKSTSGYKLTGSYEYSFNSSEQLSLNIAEDYEASSALPGLYIYLSNNPNSTAEAYEIGAVTVFKGKHSYTLPDSIKINDFKYILYWCKPFNVKVGDATIF